MEGGGGGGEGGGKGKGDGVKEGREKTDVGRVTHMSDSRAGIIAAATPTAAAPPSLMSVPSSQLDLHE